MPKQPELKMGTMPSDSISRHVAAFRRTRDPMEALRAFALVCRQGRVPEVLYSIWLSLAHRPSAVAPPPQDCGHLDGLLSSHRRVITGAQAFARAQVVMAFEPDYAVEMLPADFGGVARNGFARCGERLILGEYGDGGARLFAVDADSCNSFGFYTEDSAVRHIHALCPCPDGGLLVSTGDRAKYLDRWSVRAGSLCFEKRLRRYSGGHTGMAAVRGRCWMGTDFSGRPNCIEAAGERGRYFLPEGAYRKYTVGLHACGEHHLLAMSKNISHFGHDCTLSVFDLDARRFVHCEALSSLRDRGLAAEEDIGLLRLG